MVIRIKEENELIRKFSFQRFYCWRPQTHITYNQLKLNVKYLHKFFFRSVRKSFDLRKSLLFKLFFRNVKALNLIVIKGVFGIKSYKYRNYVLWAPNIKWSTNLEIVKHKFRSMVEIDGVVGAIGRTQIPIKAPEEHPETYVHTQRANAITPLSSKL